MSHVRTQRQEVLSIQPLAAVSQFDKQLLEEGKGRDVHVSVRLHFDLDVANSL